ncbi:hypothetical protein BS47DRAFT_1365063 [Hydnum rufescens UP504]|uniref:Uncharacterized protein n=1 Tax=Hydnum rufescens UP504 TaxID=1448309 RepID=A0A9P6AQF1_9AGAM|nr:hypothetical protein BS47DRAFT_1365063 [Hydnum rufescens UP504]
MTTPPQNKCERNLPTTTGQGTQQTKPRNENPRHKQDRGTPGRSTHLLRRVYADFKARGMKLDGRTAEFQRNSPHPTSEPAKENRPDHTRKTNQSPTSPICKRRDRTKMSTPHLPRRVWDTTRMEFEDPKMTTPQRTPAIRPNDPPNGEPPRHAPQNGSWQQCPVPHPLRGVWYKGYRTIDTARNIPPPSKTSQTPDEAREGTTPAQAGVVLLDIYICI